MNSKNHGWKFQTHNEYTCAEDDVIIMVKRSGMTNQWEIYDAVAKD